MHTREDAYFSISRTLPVQNSNNDSTAIDLEDVSPELVGEGAVLYINVPATTCATGQTITVTVQDSANNSSFAAVASLPTLVLTGVSNATAAAERQYRLPPSIRRYVRINIATSATTGDMSGFTATMKLKF